MHTQHRFHLWTAFFATTTIVLSGCAPAGTAGQTPATQSEGTVGSTVENKTGCGFPDRQPASDWSSDKFYQTNSAPSANREINVVKEIMKGNVPDTMRHFIPVQFTEKLNGAIVTMQVDVAPDYVMIGTNADWVRAPMTNYAAQYLASQMGLVLPTTHLVDIIYDKANVQLVPQPTNWYTNDPLMHLGSNYILFNQTIEAQRNGRTGLIAGDKKDVVLTNRLDTQTDKVAIYGWQQPGNKPIQPLATPHGYFYEDYSHGIRFLGPNLKITATDGSVTNMSLIEAMKDPVIGNVLNGGQGAIHDVRAARMCSPEFISAMGLGNQACPPQPKNCD